MTRSEASERLRALLLERCPAHAVEIFVAAMEVATATLRESHEAVLESVEKAVSK